MRSPQIFRPLRHQRFRRLWLGEACSALGNGITQVALPLLLLGPGRPAADLGWVLGAQSAGLISVVVFGGVVADRVDRGTQMAASDVLRLLATFLQTVGAIVGAVLASRWQPKEPGTVALLAMLGGIPVLVGLIAGFSHPLSITALLVTTTAPFAVPGVRQLGADRTDADPASAQHI